MHTISVENPAKHEKKSFKPSNWMISIKFINQLALFNNVMMVVFGEQGSGKTTFGELLCSEVHPTIQSFKLEASTPFTEEALMAKLEEACQLTIGSTATFNALIGKVNLQKKRTLIVIDNAHTIENEFLKKMLIELSNYENNNFFHICLLSDYSLVPVLNDLAIGELIDKIHSIELGALSESETKTYILNHLPITKRLDQSMTDKRLEQFYLLTGGNIALINQRMSDFFSAGTLSPSPLKKSSWRRFTVVAGSVFTLLGSFYFWQYSSPLEGTKIVSASLPLAQTQPPVIQSESPLTSELIPLSVASVKEIIQPPPLKKVITLEENEEDNLEKMVVMDKVVIIPKLIASVDEPLLPSKLVPIDQPFLPSKLATVDEPALSSKLVALADLHHPSTNKSRKPPAPNIAARRALKHIAKQAVLKSNYTIQLMASRNKQDIKRFIAVSRISKQATIRSVKRNGENWYVLVLGGYNKKEQAKFALRRLPAHLAKLNPWVRPIHGMS